MNNKNFTIYSLIKKISEKFPNRIIFSFPDENVKYTYSEFINIVDTVANNMINKGINKNDHIGLFMESCKEWFIMFFATMKIGAIAVPINTSFKEEELKYIINEFDISVLAMNEGYNKNKFQMIKNIIPTIKENTISKFSKIISIGFNHSNCISFESLCEKTNKISIDYCVDENDTCIILPTSGTTGFPKGVMLTSSAIIKNGFDIGENLKLDYNDKMLIQVPMFHCFGITLSMISSITHITPITVVDHFNPKNVLRVIEQEKITVINGVPTMFERIIQNDDFVKTNISSIKKGIMAGSNCLPEFIKTVEEKMNMKIVSVYGLTEASPGCSMSKITDDDYTRIYTVGKSLDSVTCKIINPKTGMECQIGEIGEFVVKGYNVMQGYYNNIEETNRVIDQNFFLHTGDLAKKDEYGNYIITGRLKDMIIRGGENIYPKEVEIIINKCPGVISSVVVGVKDEVYGQEIMACIISDDNVTEEDIKSYMRDKCAKYKIPKYIKFVKEFPMNAAGKVLKYKLSMI